MTESAAAPTPGPGPVSPAEPHPLPAHTLRWRVEGLDHVKTLWNGDRPMNA